MLFGLFRDSIVHADIKLSRSTMLSMSTENTVPFALAELTALQSAPQESVGHKQAASMRPSFESLKKRDGLMIDNELTSLGSAEAWGLG